MCFWMDAAEAGFYILYPYRKCSTRLVQLASLPSLPSWDSRSQQGDRPSALARPGWLDLASTGSIWLPLAPLLGPSGLEWLDLPAPGTLAGSIWLLCAVLGTPLARFGCPTSAPSTRLAKKNRFAYRRSCFDAACFVRSDTFLHASNLVCYIILSETPLHNRGWRGQSLCWRCPG